jgi:multimeric flavodoxin WrbA
MKKVLILSGSPRKNGNSDLLCDEFLRGAAESGNEAEKIRLAEKKIGYCLDATIAVNMMEHACRRMIWQRSWKR